MPDVFLFPGHATPQDVTLRDPTTAPAITGTSTGQQLAQTGSGIGVLAFVASGAGDQAAQSGGGSGTVVETAAPVVIPLVPEHLWGEWVDVRKLILDKAREMPPLEAPAPIAGRGDGDQSAQTGSCTGYVMARISGASMGRQRRQAGRSIAKISMTAKNERELLELLLLEAA